MAYFNKRIDLIFLLMLVILSMSMISASHAADVHVLNDTSVDLNESIASVDVAKTDVLNDTTVDLNQNVTLMTAEGSITQASLNSTIAVKINSTPLDNISTGSIPNNSTYYHSLESCFIKNLVENYGRYNITELASIYTVDTSCINNALQLIRCGVYGDDLKNKLNHKDYVLTQFIKHLTTCQPNFSKMKNKRGSVFGSDTAEKILEMYGNYSIREMAAQFEKENITIEESDIQLILYHIKMNDGMSGYGDNLQKIYNKKERYLNQTIPQLQSYLIKTDTISCKNPKTSDYNITFNDVEEYCLNNTYTVRLFDNQGKPSTSGHVSFFINDNLKYVGAVDEDGLVSFNLNDIIKTMGQYTITCLYSNTVKRDNITIGNITLNDFFKVKTIFEGVKVYNPGELYKVKFLSTNGKNLTGSEVIFSINNEIIGMGAVDDDGIASCKIDENVAKLLESPNCFIKSTFYDETLNDILPVSEYITVGTRSIPVTSKGSLLPKWRDAICEVCDDGYHVYIDKNNYQLIEFDGTSFIVHVENITNTNQLKNFFKTLSSEDVKWDIVIINLAKGTYDVDFGFYSDREWDYSLKFSFGQLIINGNGATFDGDYDINFLNVGNGANVVINHLTFKHFAHCFFNYGMLYCSQSKFIDNNAIKTDVLLEGSGTVIHNYNTAEFFACTFSGNNAQYCGLRPTHMAGSILYAEPYSTTYFDRNIYEGQLYDDSILACKYSSIVITPSYGQTEWTYEHFIGKSFIHYLASVSFINPCETIFYDNYVNNYNPLIFNCSNSSDLANALKFINKEGVMGSEVIINLVNTTYSFTSSEANTLDMDYGKGYRGSFFSNLFNGVIEEYRDYDHKVYMNYQQHYFINVGGFIPITINGNGAHIKISDNEIDNDNHFAFIGHNARLTLNNLTLSTFNTAFINAHGNLICNACDISENKIEYTSYSADDGGVLRSFAGSSIFKNCIMKNNRATDGTDFAYAEDGSYVELDNCTISQHYTTYATLKDSTIKCPYDLYKNHISATSTKFINITSKEELAIYVINNTEELKDIYSSKTWADTTVFVFNCSCSADLNRLISHPGSTYIKANGHNIKVSSSELTIIKDAFVCLEGFTFTGSKFFGYGILSLINCTLTNCESVQMFTNIGDCSIYNCKISNNNCKNVFENKGTLTICNSIINKNKATEYGIIYNNEGSVVLSNVTFSSNNGKEVYNFRTSNCALIGCAGAEVIFKEPLSAVKLDGIKLGFTAGTMLICGGVGFGYAALLGSCISGLVLTGVTGTLLGGGIGLAFGAIESSTYHDYSHLWSNVGTFALIGMSSCMFGYYLGTVKYETNIHKEVYENVNGEEIERQVPYRSETPSGQEAKLVDAGTYKVKVTFNEYQVEVPDGMTITTDDLDYLTKETLNQMKTLKGYDPSRVAKIRFVVTDHSEIIARVTLKRMPNMSFGVSVGYLQ